MPLYSPSSPISVSEERQRSYDPDAFNFFNTAGVRNLKAKAQISRFVTGIKDLGLWNSMVCWPLRSSQNAGSGTTAYSIGGFGTYNGTFNGSVSWSELGVVLPANASISASVPYGATGGSLIGVIRADSVSGPSRDYALLKNNSSGFWSPYGDGNFYFDYPESTNRLSVSSGITQGVLFYLAGYAGSGGSKIYRNNALLSSNAVSANNSGNTTWIVGSLASSASQVSSFAMLLSTDASANHSSIYSLYKSTLGQGLGLP